MLREITLGQYYPVDSLLHRLDPRVKLAGTFLFLIALFIVNSWTAYIFLALVLLLLIKLSNVPFSFMVRGLKSVLFLLLLSVSFNLFLTPGKEIFRFYIFKISQEGLHIASMMAVRLILLVLSSSLMTLCTTPNELTDGMEKGLSILKKLHLPIHEIAMMMSIALRFIPILVPLFVSAFRRAYDLALAMESRCYQGGEGRTKMKPLHYERRDYLSYLFLLIVLALSIGSRFVSLP